MSGLQSEQLIYAAAAARLRVPTWAPFLPFPNVFGAHSLTTSHRLDEVPDNNQNRNISSSCSSTLSHDDTNDDRGKLFPSAFHSRNIHNTSLLCFH